MCRQEGRNADNRAGIHTTWQSVEGGEVLEVEEDDVVCMMFLQL